MLASPTAQDVDLGFFFLAYVDLGFFSLAYSPSQRLTDEYDRYIVLSFTNATMVLEVRRVGCRPFDMCNR